MYSVPLGGEFNQSVLTLTSAGSVMLPLPIDDRENEITEGYLLLLQVDTNNMHPADARRLQFLNRYILVTIEDDDSKSHAVNRVVMTDNYAGPLTCRSSVLDEIVSIDCVGSDGLPPPTDGSIQCAINNLTPFNCETATSALEMHLKSSIFIDIYRYLPV